MDKHNKKIHEIENTIRYGLNERLLNVIVLSIGIIAVLFGVIFNIAAQQETLSIVLISIGASLIASAVVTYLTSIYVFGHKRGKEITEVWGLNAIYETRQKMNNACDIYVDSVEDRLDIVAFGLRSFRDSKDQIIREKVKRGLKIRILTIHPDSSFLAQRELDELKASGDIRESIVQLNNWINELKSLEQGRSFTADF